MAGRSWYSPGGLADAVGNDYEIVATFFGGLATSSPGLVSRGALRVLTPIISQGKRPIPILAVTLPVCQLCWALAGIGASGPSLAFAMRSPATPPVAPSASATGFVLRGDRVLAFDFWILKYGLSDF